MFSAGPRGTCVIICVHLDLRRSVVFLIVRGRVPPFDLETSREDPAAHYVITFECVPLVQILREE